MKNILIAFLYAAFLLTACKKTDVNNGSGGTGGGTTPPTGGVVLKGTTLLLYDTLSGARVDSIIYSYGYDAQQRVISAQSKTYMFSAAYPDGLLVSLDTTLAAYGTGTISVSEQTWYASLHLQTVLTTIYLHASGGQLADSSRKTTTLYTPVASSSLENWVYTYDANGYLTHQDDYLLTNGGKQLEEDIAFMVQNGNTVGVNNIVYLVPGNLSSAIVLMTASTFLNQAAPVTNYTGNGNNFIGIGSIITGHANTDLIHTVSTNGILSGVFTYTQDNQNRLSTTTERTGSGALSFIDHYMY